MDLVQRLLTETVGSHPRVLTTPPPAIFLRAFVIMPCSGKSRVCAPSARSDATAHELLLQIDQVFRQHAIAIPFPQQDVHLRSADATLVIQPMSNGYETVAAHTELPLAVSNNTCSRCVSARLLSSSLCYTIAYSAAAGAAESMEEIHAQTPVRTTSYNTRQARWGARTTAGLLGVLGLLACLAGCTDLILWSALSLRTPWLGTKRASLTVHIFISASRPNT